MKEQTFTKDGRTYRRLKRGDLLRKTDWQWTADGELEFMKPNAFPVGEQHEGERVQIGKLEGYRNDFFRDITDEPTKQTKKVKANANSDKK